MGRKMLDRTGRRYGKLTVVGFAGYNKGVVVWKCLCDCGNTTIVRGISLGLHTNSCGCERKMLSKLEHTTHGMSKTRIYNIWHGMMQRCYTPSVQSYKSYGARGITVCDKWKTFDGFYEDMGSTYNDRMSIERKDGNGNYCKENCKWIPLEEQNRNRKGTYQFQVDGEYMPLKQICENHNMGYLTILKRLKKGMSLEEALNKPLGVFKGKRK
jgi:hypothetical protein